MEIKYLEYEKAEAAKPEWLWSGFIRLGKVCLITGEGGVGKSTLTYKLISAITRGEALPRQDEANVPPSFCIVQNSEDEPDEDTLPQLEYFDADMSKVRSIDADGVPLTLLDERFDIAVAHWGAKLLVIDPLCKPFHNGSRTKTLAFASLTCRSRIFISSSIFSDAALINAIFEQSAPIASRRGLSVSLEPSSAFW